MQLRVVVYQKAEAQVHLTAEAARQQQPAEPQAAQPRAR
jgi:hypothetical protein